MSDSRGNRAADDESRGGKEPGVAKTAGIVVFSGIAMSILQAFFPKKEAQHQPLAFPEPMVPKEPIIPAPPETTRAPETVKIEKGDTLWGLSRKYGVSIDAIKEANGLTGDTIYAGKKLVIP
ncbi:hypothetical protein H6P81_014337 [Aristolochia fimbriata]|uniref:LysM domain-containing protein n=1 Tax=Aristolochia fimbriata TaxID=158543 RepID=A0AAV7EIR0_ARIFI|nr:hypothetical protein H6P81_014337 [Aristolochia fimbriata]